MARAPTDVRWRGRAPLSHHTRRRCPPTDPAASARMRRGLPPPVGRPARSGTGRGAAGPRRAGRESGGPAQGAEERKAGRRGGRHDHQDARRPRERHRRQRGAQDAPGRRRAHAGARPAPSLTAAPAALHARLHSARARRTSTRGVRLPPRASHRAPWASLGCSARPMPACSPAPTSGAGAGRAAAGRAGGGGRVVHELPQRPGARRQPGHPVHRDA